MTFNLHTTLIFPEASRDGRSWFSYSQTHFQITKQQHKKLKEDGTVNGMSMYYRCL